MSDMTPAERDVAHVADLLGRALAPLGEDLVAWTARTARAGSDDDLTLLALFARQAALALEASARTRRIGDIVVAALRGVSDDASVADTLRRAVTDEPDDDITDIAAAFAELASAGPQERAL